ncbi:uncharacterized protein N7503_003974 [Penicillium pulvis]|uniref:uncharacterized protein n=1 Tax=Penicillium pulvis TaxID=1562058 RepID=UPI002549A3AC|nr:uncharacterized protein N7503_003974 [Penicillium pulvis]KAJ5806372.1 hypothetical protein N7503_003974 [Penicillium pulvis]
MSVESGGWQRVDAVISSSFYKVPSSSIKIDDVIMLGGSTCKVIKITDFQGWPRFDGIDIFLGSYESQRTYFNNPSQGETFMYMLAPVLEYYQVADVEHGVVNVLNKETGVKETLRVLNIPNLSKNIVETFNSTESPVWVGTVRQGRIFIVAFDTKERPEN